MLPMDMPMLQPTIWPVKLPHAFHPDSILLEMRRERAKPPIVVINLGVQTVVPLDAGGKTFSVALPPGHWVSFASWSLLAHTGWSAQRQIAMALVAECEEHPLQKSHRSLSSLNFMIFNINGGNNDLKMAELYRLVCARSLDCGLLNDIRWQASKHGPWLSEDDCGGVPFWGDFRAFSTLLDDTTPAGVLFFYNANFRKLLNPAHRARSIMPGRLLLIPLLVRTVPIGLIAGYVPHSGRRQDCQACFDILF
jgi:hypothetical protein